MSLRLADCSVFVDFDGTISTEDIGVRLLERFVPGRWQAVDGRYERGEIGSRQYVGELWALLGDVDLAELRSAAGEVPLDPGLPSLLAFLRSGGAEVAVVSDGLGFYVATRCRPFGVPVVANDVTAGATGGHRPVFGRPAPHDPWDDPRDRCPCGLCGTCKAEPVRRARARGRTTVVVGDGTSDRFGAAEADVVFARDRLADWCRAGSTDYVPFDGLADVEAALRAMAPAG
ncbi:MAG TPA: HAD-IB family phosphatase [Acidimicrobiales bacterium]|nr:HAD-IB family phosphatase [Acidimicrobiales bacterium]